MSYDIYIGPWSSNYTSNVSEVFYDHMDGGIRSLDGLSGYDAAARLGAFFNEISRTQIRMYARDPSQDKQRGEPMLCDKYDPENGWGSLVGALIWAGQIMAACLMYPTERVEISA